jgi:(E)-4-hydroxy-3-methylbut-2-enyl-diphosphate synthase
MGCMVNGPGEAREADLGVACGRDSGVLFKDGKILRRVPAKAIAAELARELDRLAEDGKEPS